MAKASLTLPDGTTVQIEGNADEIQKIISLHKPTEPSSPKVLHKPKPRKPKPKTNQNESESKIDISGLVNFIKEQDEFPIIEQKILDKKDRMPKILMSFYYASNFFETPYLTTGNVETITDQFGAKIKTSNISTTIKGNLKYFSQDQVRKKGALLKYKLNRTGVQEFEKLLKEGKSE
jgi:hypothetical protein